MSPKYDHPMFSVLLNLTIPGAIFWSYDRPRLGLAVLGFTIVISIAAAFLGEPYEELALLVTYLTCGALASLAFYLASREHLER